MTNEHQCGRYGHVFPPWRHTGVVDWYLDAQDPAAVSALRGEVVDYLRRHAEPFAHDGELLFERVRRMREAAHSIAEMRQPVLALPIVRITGDAWLLQFVAQNLDSLRTPEDGFRLCFKIGNPRANLLHRESDIGLSDERPETGNVAARRLSPVAFAPYCSRGMAGLEQPAWAALGTEVAVSPAALWTARQTDLWITTWANTPHMLAELIRSGAGCGVLPCFLGDADPGLVRMGPPIEEVGYEAWLMMHDDERHRPEMRTAIERLAALFARERRQLAGDVQEERAGVGE
jgi:hypothetical protein